MSNNKDDDPDNPYIMYDNMSVIKYDKKFDGVIIDINGNIFNIFVQEHINDITLDQIKYFYNALYVIEVILQLKLKLIDSYTKYPEYPEELNKLYNTFYNMPNNFLILMMWWLTFIINTGWFYVDLDPYNPLHPDFYLTEKLYKDLGIIEKLLFSNNGYNLFINFLKNDFDSWNYILLVNIIPMIKDDIQKPKVLSSILRSHISNLFTFIHNDDKLILDKDILDKDINNFIKNNINIFEKYINVQQPTQQPTRRNKASLKVVSRKNLGNNEEEKRKEWINKGKQIREKKLREKRFNLMRDPERFPKGGDYTKKKRYLKAIKRNIKRYSIKKKHKKTKKKNRQKGKIVKTYKL
jgi:hypothetical protein